MTDTLRTDPAARGTLTARLAGEAAEVRAAQALRHRRFIDARGLPPRPDGLDADAHDPHCRHLLVEDADRRLLATARLRVFADGRGLSGSYAAATHDLARLARFPSPLLELGRFCVREGAPEAVALRAAWGLLVSIVEAEGVRLLFGCSSFVGADPTPHRPAFALLGRDHLAPDAWSPGRGAAESLDLAAIEAPPDRLAALRAMPPLLRSYLAMGAWVGRHAVIDRSLDTIHVLTAVEIARVPPARVRALKALGPG